MKLKIRRGWNRATLLRYSLLQLPEIIILAIALYLVRLWVGLPVWVTVLILAGWILKDIALFPFVWPAYDKDHRGSSNTMIGKTGQVEKALNPDGLVKIHGERWKATANEDRSVIEVGRMVRVIDHNNLTLIVEELPD